MIKLSVSGDFFTLIDKIKNEQAIFRDIVAEEFHTKISKYPNYVPDKVPGKTFYRRGSGTIYLKKSGGQTAYKNSEQLSKRWSVESFSNRTIVRNKASYAKYVHMSEYQNKRLYQIGWENEKTVFPRIDFQRALSIAKSKVKV